MNDRDIGSLLKTILPFAIVFPFFALSKVAAAQSSDLNHERLHIHPFHIKTGHLKIAPAEAEQSSLDSQAAAVQNLNSVLSLSKIDGSSLRLRGSAATRSLSDSSYPEDGLYDYTWSGLAICDAFVRFKSLKDGRKSVNGNVPRRSWSLAAFSLEKTDPETLLARLPEAASERKLLDGISFLHGQKFQSRRQSECLILRDGQLLAARNLIVRVAGLAYRIRISRDLVEKIEPLYFHADAEALLRAYVQNPTDGDMEDSLVEVTPGSGLLINRHFKTEPPDDVPAAKASESTFFYAENDPRFAEVNVFAHANRMYDYYESLGYSWKSKAPLVLRPNAVIGSTVNNALYQPGDAFEDELPRISIGEGDGKILQNLALDSDVVSHEFGHHVIFASLKSISGESLVLHEGLADFFAFSLSGDNCLGESICPEGSRACWNVGQCLRSGIDDSATLNYGDETFVNLEAHRQSQVISGLLWQLRSRMGEEETAKLVMEAIGHFIDDSGYRDFFLALLYADHDLNDGKNACTIYELALERGFESFVSDIDCSLASNPDSLPVIAGGGGTGSGGSNTSNRSSKTPYHCGVLAGDRGDSSGKAGLGHWLLFILPLIMPFGWNGLRKSKS